MGRSPENIEPVEDIEIQQRAGLGHLAAPLGELEPMEAQLCELAPVGRTHPVQLNETTDDTA